MIDDLIAFHKARLDEDEAAARESYYEGQRWITEEEGIYRYPADEVIHYADRKADARHIARHDPARALRDVEAKRALLAEYARALEKAPGNTPLINALIRVIKAQAAVDADHPDYREDWKP